MHLLFAGGQKARHCRTAKQPVSSHSPVILPRVLDLRSCGDGASIYSAGLVVGMADGPSLSWRMKCLYLNDLSCVLDKTMKVARAPAGDVNRQLIPAVSQASSRLNLMR